MERRRIIGYILLALAAVICLVSNVWFIVKMPMGGEKISYLILRTVPMLLVLLATVYTFVRTGRTMNLKLDIRERRIKKVKHHAIDPDGFRYVSFGAMSLFIVIAFTVDLMHTLGQSPFNRIDAGTAVLVLVLLCMGFAIWGEIKVRLANPNM